MSNEEEKIVPETQKFMNREQLEGVGKQLDDIASTLERMGKLPTTMGDLREAAEKLLLKSRDIEQVMEMAFSSNPIVTSEDVPEEMGSLVFGADRQNNFPGGVSFTAYGYDSGKSVGKDSPDFEIEPVFNGACDRWPDPWKAENISYEQVVAILSEELRKRLEEGTLELYWYTGGRKDTRTRMEPGKLYPFGENDDT
jgi:hypothetical protein